MREIMENVRQYPVQVLEEVYFNQESNTNGFKLAMVCKNITGQGRWDTYYDLIFKDELIDKFYKATYSQGSTELQETRGFEKDDNGNVTCYEVEPIAVTITKFVEIGKSLVSSEGSE